MKDLWMKALRDLELEVLPDGGRRLWWLRVPVHQTYLYMTHYIIRNIHELEFYIRWIQRPFSREIEQREYEEKPQGFEVYQKETLVCRWKKILYGLKQLGAKLLMHNKSVVKILYDKSQNGYSEVQDDGLLIHDKLSWWQKKCHMDTFQPKPCHDVMS